MPNPVPTPLADTVGRTVQGVALDDVDLILKFNGGVVFSILTIDWDQGINEPTLSESGFSLLRHGPKAVVAGIISQNQLDTLIIDAGESQQAQNEARRYATYLRLKEIYEP